MKRLDSLLPQNLYLGIEQKLPLFTAYFIIAINLVAIAYAFTKPSPISGYETAAVVEAARVAQNLPLYVEGHATFSYGPLALYPLGYLFKLTGPGLYVARLLSILSGLAVVVILSLAFAKENFWVACGLLIGINSRTNNYFVDARPDSLCLLLMVVGLIYFFKHKIGIGTLLMCLAFLIKQTSIVAVVVPLGACLFGVAQKKTAWIPLAACIASVLVIKFAFPDVYYYIMVMPRGFSISRGLLLKNLWDMILTMPLFFLLLLEYSGDRVEKWAIAGAVLAIPAGAAFAAKFGGIVNSFMMAFCAMFAYCARRLPQYKIEKLHVGLIVSLLMLVSAFAHAGSSFSVVFTPADKDYGPTIEAVKALPGKVVCPEDPSIPLFAKGTVGEHWTVAEEYWLAKGEHHDTPPHVLREVDSADYVVQINTELFPDELLLHRGFRLVSDGRYRLWQREF